MAGRDRDQLPAEYKLKRPIAELFEKRKGVVEPITAARRMIARELEHQARPKPPQGVPTAVQQAQFPALDFGLDEIEAIEPKRRDDRIEGGQRAPTRLRPNDSPASRDAPGRSQGRRDF